MNNPDLDEAVLKALHAASKKRKPRSQEVLEEQVTQFLQALNEALDEVEEQT